MQRQWTTSSYSYPNKRKALKGSNVKIQAQANTRGEGLKRWPRNQEIYLKTKLQKFDNAFDDMPCHAMFRKQNFTSRTRVVALNLIPTPKDKERLFELRAWKASLKLEMGIGPRTKGDIKTSIKKLAYPKPTHKPKEKKTNLKIHHLLHPAPPPKSCWVLGI